MKPELTIAGRKIGDGHPTYVIAELSANHGQSFQTAVDLVQAAKAAGANAVKLQTYTPDTITLRSDRSEFQIGKGTIWEGKTLYQLYGEAYTPWEWQPKLRDIANELGMALFSSPFDFSAVDFLETMNVPAYKIASFEIVDTPLIARVASTGKPIIISTGMATRDEITEAVAAAREGGAREIALLKCTSAYPALPEEANLRTIPDLAAAHQVVVGLSDHTLGIAAAAAAVSIGARIVEKHLTLSRKTPGPDSAFSLEPSEFQVMVETIRTVEKALGRVSYEVTEKEAASRVFRRSLFVTRDVEQGEIFSSANVRSIRPAHGLHPKHLPTILGKHAAQNIEAGTPLAWNLIKS